MNIKPISNEKRAMIIVAKNRGESTAEIIKWVGEISISSIDKIWHLFRKTGSYEPKPDTGHNHKITPEHDEQRKPCIFLMRAAFTAV
jgi:transposase